MRKKYKEMNTSELVHLAQKDNYIALEELIRREQKNIYAAFYYLDPNRENLMDLTQEALLRMSKNIKNLKNPKMFKSWQGQIISNLFYDELRKKQKTPRLLYLDETWDNEENSSPVHAIKDKKATPAENSMAHELNDIIKEKINELPEQFRFVIVLREIQGLSYDEIAKITKTSVGTVKSRIARARSKLQEYLKPYIA
ncbi:MAG: sigma-70 family RNA polymerase sigma factor [Candidatus Gastranaerophilales bacterium]|nr:sigma-70 family RNA polymerase sigma factor [Candidatus Gastranaerophilales bacterium]